MIQNISISSKKLEIDSRSVSIRGSLKKDDSFNVDLLSPLPKRSVSFMFDGSTRTPTKDTSPLSGNATWDKAKLNGKKSKCVLHPMSYISLVHVDDEDRDQQEEASFDNYLNGYLREKHNSR